MKNHHFSLVKASESIKEIVITVKNDDFSLNSVFKDYGEHIFPHSTFFKDDGCFISPHLFTSVHR
jgi:hypothetical protein